MSDHRHPVEGRCRESVLVRDTYRVARDGKRHFKLHYNKRQCKRSPVSGSGYLLAAQTAGVAKR